MVIVIGSEDWFPGLLVSRFELLQRFLPLRASIVSTFGNNRAQRMLLEALPVH